MNTRASESQFLHQILLAGWAKCTCIPSPQSSNTRFFLRRFFISLGDHNEIVVFVNPTRGVVNLCVERHGNRFAGQSSSFKALQAHLFVRGRISYTLRRLEKQDC